MKNLKADIKKLWERKKFSDIIALIDKADPYYLDAELLVTKGISILCLDDTKYTINDVKKLYEQAIKLDPDYFDAYQEMGYYHFVLTGDDKQSKQYFKAALDIKFQTDLKHLKDLYYYTEETESTRMRDDIFIKLNSHVKNLEKITSKKKAATKTKKASAPKKAAKKK